MSVRQATAISQQSLALELEASLLIEAGKFEQAESNLKQSEQLIQQLPERTGNVRWRRGAMLAGIQGARGRILFRQGRYSEAEAAYRVQIDATEQEFATDSENLIAGLMRIVTLQLRRNKFDGVEDLLQRALQLDARRGGRFPMGTAAAFKRQFTTGSVVHMWTAPLGKHFLKNDENWRLLTYVRPVLAS